MAGKLLVPACLCLCMASLGLGQPASSVWGSAGMSGQFGQIKALAVFDDGSGPALYAGGYIWGGARGVWRWDGNSWISIGSTPGWVYALGVFDDGSGARLYAGGQFTSMEGVSANRVAMWDGTSWSALGSGVSGGASTGATVRAFTVFDDGSGPDLYVGGSFGVAGGITSPRVARWDGQNWSAPNPTPPFWGPDGTVSSFAVHDDGTGPALYCGGTFTANLSGVFTTSILRWNGAAWSGLGGGLKFLTFEGTVSALAVMDEGAGTRLFAGGRFDGAPGCTLTGVDLARWDGSCWTGVGGGVGGSGDLAVTSLGVFDDGGGSALYIGGKYFWWAGTSTFLVNNVVRWKNGAFQALGGGIYSSTPSIMEVAALQEYDDGSGADLYACGGFTHADFLPTGCIARFGGRSPTLSLTQPGGPGSAVLVTDTDLMPGREYYNIFSFETCPGGSGSGPYLGLCATFPQFLFDQFNLPVGSPPFHFLAQNRVQSFGPYPLPVNTTVQGVCFDFTHQKFVAWSPVVELTVY